MPLTDYFEAIHFYRNTSRKLQVDDRHWDDRADIPADVFEKLKEWMDVVLQRKVRRFDIPSEKHTLTTDASAYGSGAVHIDHQGGEWHLAQCWEKQYRFSKISTATESEGVFRMAQAALPKARRLLCTVFCDNTPTVYAGNAGYSRSARINGALAKLFRCFPLVDFQFSYIQGKKNIIPDKNSRLGLGAPSGDGKVTVIQARCRGSHNVSDPLPETTCLPVDASIVS
jgi:hypothetical protein